MTKTKRYAKPIYVLVALVLVLSFSLVTAVPVVAVTPPHDRTAAITAAADRLAEQQNTGDGYDEGYIGGWRMWIGETPPGTYLRTHNIGVTAIGILKAHELQDEVAYETALAKAYKFVVDHEPGWIQDPNDATKWKESPGGVNSWPDIHFLIGLAEAAESDSSLLAAINTLIEPDITASDIVALAKDRWDDRLNHTGAVYPSEVGTATGMADWLVNLRIGQGYETLIPWDLEPAVKSAVALHEKYPGDGYLAQAQDIAEAIYGCIYGDPSYLDINDPTEKCYTLGLAGAIEAFTEAGLYPVEASQLKDLLIAYQNEVGFWDANDRIDEDAGTQCVQETAYAVMALIAQGDADARTAAMKGSSWLVNTQDVLGGWDPSSFESGDENLECDGEATWALATAEAPVTIDSKGYYSIQDAIDAASPGDTIVVAAGTYYENVVIGKSLTLKAASTPVIDGGLAGPCVTIAANGVTIDGFELKNGSHGIFSLDTDNSTIKNCDIHDNLCTSFGCGMGIGFWTGTGTVDFDNNTIVNNTIYNNDRQGIYIGWLSWPPPTVYSDGNTIRGNTIYNNGLYTLANGPDESQYGIQLCFADNNTIQDNEIYGHNTWWFGQGIYLFASYDNTVTENNIHDNSYGINLWEGGWSGRTIGNNYINYNTIAGNGFGMWNIDGAAVTVDATLNWWGDVSGPYHPTSWDYYGVEITNPDGLGDEVTDYVLYEPWIGQEGMATGGGWFIPEWDKHVGLVTPGGKATFGFVAKQKKGTSSGQLEFQYQADDLKLKSTSYDWVSVASVQVMFEGEGVLNGVAGYRFRVWAFDGDKAGGQPDRFTIRIWTGGDSYESPTYRAEGDLGGGQIVVHKK